VQERYARYEPRSMLSALLMLRRVARALGYAVREEAFLPVLGAGVLLVFLGGLTYTLSMAFVTVQEEEKKAKEN
jgi:hypothetical protein